MRFIFLQSLIILLLKLTQAYKADPDIPTTLANERPCSYDMYKAIVKWTVGGLPERSECRPVTNCNPPFVSAREPQEFEDRICCPSPNMDIFYDTLNKKYRCFLAYKVGKGRKWVPVQHEDLERGPRGGHGMEILCKNCAHLPIPLYEGKQCSGYEETVCCTTPKSGVISIDGKYYCIPPDSLWHKYRQKSKGEASTTDATEGCQSTGVGNSNGSKPAAAIVECKFLIFLLHIFCFLIWTFFYI